jgi:hypothetical protein
MKGLVLSCMFLVWAALPLHGQDLDTEDVCVTLDSALRIADKVAAAAFPELPDYLLYSVTPRVLKADPGGLHWQVQWQARAFPHHQWLVVRVYMKDGHTTTERRDDSQVPRSDQGSASRNGGGRRKPGASP